MNAFTVTTEHEEWTALTQECVSRLHRFAGVTARAVTAQDEFDSHVQKLTVPLGAHEDAWFFDSDWWLLREATLPPIPRGGIVATWCRTGHERYINTCVDLRRIFGTTFFGADLQDKRVRQAFTHALHLQSESYWDGRPKADESFLNIAVQQLGIPVTFLPPAWNHCAEPEPETIALHAGGRWPKLEWMRNHSRLTQTHCVNP